MGKDHLFHLDLYNIMSSHNWLEKQDTLYWPVLNLDRNSVGDKAL